MSLDPAFYPALIAAARRGNFDPADMLLFLASESNLSPAATNGWFFGLSQVSGTWLGDHGIDPEEFIRRPASLQVPIIELYASTKSRFGPARMGKAPWPNAVTMYQGNFFPSTLTESIEPSFILVSKSGYTDSKNITKEQSKKWYHDNQILDQDKNGRITIADLARRLERIANGKGPEGPGFLRALERLNAARNGKPVVLASGWRLWPIVSVDRDIEPIVNEEQLKTSHAPEMPVISPEGPLLPGHDGKNPLVPAGWAAPDSDRSAIDKADDSEWVDLLKIIGAITLAFLPLSAMAGMGIRWVMDHLKKR